jgi:hypothetical protein
MAEEPARVTYTGNGSTTDFVVPFSYLDSSHVMASVNGVPTSFLFLDASTIRFIPAPAAASVVLVYRQTVGDPLVNFSNDPSVINRGDSLDTALTQARMIAQEARVVANEVHNIDGAATAATTAVAAALEADASATEAEASAAAAAASAVAAAASAAAAGGEVPPHAHAIADTTGLQTALDAKANYSAIPPIETAVAGKQAHSTNLDGWSAIAPASKQNTLTLATQAEAEVGTEATHYMTPQRVSQAIAALGNPAVARAWQTPSRTRNTIYYNTSGHEIVVRMLWSADNSGGTATTFYINEAAFSNTIWAGFNEWRIPIGASYRWGTSLSSTPTSWQEFI